MHICESIHLAFAIFQMYLFTVRAHFTRNTFAGCTLMKEQEKEEWKDRRKKKRAAQHIPLIVHRRNSKELNNNKLPRSTETKTTTKTKSHRWNKKRLRSSCDDRESRRRRWLRVRASFRSQNWTTIQKQLSVSERKNYEKKNTHLHENAQLTIRTHIVAIVPV